VVDLNDAVRRAGLRPIGIELVASSLVTAVDEAGHESGAEAIVHVSRSMTLVLIGDERGLVFTRVITAGVDIGERSLSEELEMELATLAGYAEGQSESAPDPAPTTAPSIFTVVEGIRRTLQYYTAEIDQRPVHRVLLCGPQAEAAGLASAIGDSIPDSEILRHQFSGFPEDIEDADLVSERQEDRLLLTEVNLVESLGSEIILHVGFDAEPYEIMDVEFEGEDAVSASSDEAGRYTYVARVNPRSRAVVGQEIGLTVDTGRMHFFDPTSGEAIRA
jgi:hypothetical protein